MKSESFRPNAALIFQRSSGHILICERMKTRGAWQFPQGGLDAGETPAQAAMREGLEETGFTPEEYDIVESRGLYRYYYPQNVQKHVRHKRGYNYIGQEQTYFLCRMRDDTDEPRIDNREFRAYRWILPQEFDLAWLPPFKRGVYEQVLKDFFPAGA